MRADVGMHCVLADTVVCQDEGFLEQLVCLAGTREHESILALTARPRDVHAALLLVGAEPGDTGSWRQGIAPNGAVTTVAIPPSGSRLSVWARWVDGSGSEHESRLHEWVRDVNSGLVMPDGPFVFSGSIVQDVEERDASGEPTGEVRTVYAADLGGSVVGLVTFGDEVVAWQEVIPDQVDVAPAVWVADPSVIPALGTPVTLVLCVEHRQ